MNWIRLFILAVPVMLVACQSISDKDTIAKLRHMEIEIKEEKIEGGLDKAMLSYQRFLEETPDSALAPEAIRRLADLKIEKEYGTLTEGARRRTGSRTPPRAGHRSRHRGCRSGRRACRAETSLTAACPGTRGAFEIRLGRRCGFSPGIGTYSSPQRVRGGL